MLKVDDVQHFIEDYLFSSEPVEFEMSVDRRTGKPIAIQVSKGASFGRVPFGFLKDFVNGLLCIDYWPVLKGI